MKILRYLLCVALASVSIPLAAQPASSPAAPTESQHPILVKRIAELPSVLNEKLPLADFLNDAFLAAVPEAQVKALISQWRAQYGDAGKAEVVARQNQYSVTLAVTFERAVATVDLTVDPKEPHKVAGLLVKGFAVSGDSLQKIEAELSALPGEVSYLVQKLDGSAPIAARNGDKPMAIASSFKLYVLAELAAQVRSGKRKWSDVVLLGPPVPSSSATQGWATGTPVTFQTLAVQMISVSDNRATDSLIATLGRTAVEERVVKTGIAAPDKMLPLLTTTEVFALKSKPELRARYLALGEKQQRAFLTDEAAALTDKAIDFAQLGSGPVAIDSIEWFASANDLARLLAGFDRADADTLAVLSVNSGVAPALAAKWRFVGYKGGSEAGVIAMNYLAQAQSGDWYVVTGAWNNPNASVDNAAFAALMTRLLDSVAR